VGGSGVDELDELQRILEASVMGPSFRSGVESVGKKKLGDAVALGH
jgi:hypothetical protein